MLRLMYAASAAVYVTKQHLHFVFRSLQEKNTFDNKSGRNTFVSTLERYPLFASPLTSPSRLHLAHAKHMCSFQQASVALNSWHQFQNDSCSLCLWQCLRLQYMKVTIVLQILAGIVGTQKRNSTDAERELCEHVMLACMCECYYIALCVFALIFAQREFLGTSLWSHALG